MRAIRQGHMSVKLVVSMLRDFLWKIPKARSIDAGNSEYLVARGCATLLEFHDNEDL
jgi:hypothetical protein